MQRVIDYHQDIASQRRELAGIPNSIQGLENQIAGHEQQIAVFQADLIRLQQEQADQESIAIAQLKARKIRLTAPAQMRDLATQISTMQQSLQSLHHQLAATMVQLAPVDAELSRLHSAIGTLEAQYKVSALQQQIDIYRPVILNQEAELRSLNIRRIDIVNPLQSAESCLSSLRSQQSWDVAINHNPWGHHGHDGYYHGHHHHGHANFGDVLHAVGDGALSYQISNKQSEVDRLRGQLSSVDASIRAAVSAINNNHNHVSMLQEQIAASDRDRRKHLESARQSDLSLSLDQLKSRAREQDGIRVPHARQRAMLQSEIDETTRILSSFQIHYDELQSDFTHAETLSQANPDIFAMNNVDQINSLLQQRCQTLQANITRQQRIEADCGRYQQAINDARNAITRLSQREGELREELAYPDAVDRFVNLLNQKPEHANGEMNHFYEHGWKMLTAIREEKANAERKSRQNFDAPLYVDILNAASNVLQTQADLDSLQQLNNVYRRNNHGKASMAKKVLGAIGMFIGGALVLVCSTMLAGLLPVISWPAAGVGVAVGAGLLVASTMLLISGRQKGIDKMLRDFREAAPRVYEHQRLFYQAPHLDNHSGEAYHEPSAPPLALMPQ